MNDLVLYQPGKYGLRAVLRAPWSLRMLEEMQIRNVKEIELNAGKGWSGSDISGGWALGDARFQRRIASAAGRRATPLAPGRPAGNKADKRQLNLL